MAFPFLFGGTFIEAYLMAPARCALLNFPSFSEGLSLRPVEPEAVAESVAFPFLFGGTFIEAQG